MPKQSLNEIFGGTQQSVSQDNTQNNSRQSLDEIFSEQSGQEQIQPQQDSLQIMSQKSAGLSLKQNLILSLAPNDEVRAQYLQKELQGRDVKINPEIGLTVDGLPVNPKGFDTGDISRNAGQILPFAGQVIGSLLGLGAGAATGPGAVATTVAGGVGGSTIGEGLRLSMGQYFGLSQDGEDVTNALIENAGASAIGEVAGLGLGAVIAKVGANKALSGLADSWKKSFDKLGKDLTPTVAQFVGGIKPSATKIFQENGFKNLDEFMDPSKITKIANKTLFGKENINLAEQFYGKSDIQKGTVDIIKSLKKINNESFDNVIKFASGEGIDNKLISDVRRFGIDELTNPIHTAQNRALDLSDSIINSVKANISRLGQNLGKSELKAVANNKSSKFELESISKKIDSLASSVDVGKGIKVDKFKPMGAVQVKGADKLKEIQKIFKGSLTEKEKARLLKEGFTPAQVSAMRPPKEVSYKQAMRLKKNFDVKVSEFFNDPKIPSQLRNSVREIAEEFRGQYYQRLGIEQQATAFREFQNVLDGLAINKDSQRKSIELLVKGFSNRSGMETTRLINILNNVEGGKGLIKNLQLHQTATSLSKLDSQKIATNFGSKISSGRLLDLTKNDTQELLLQDLDSGLTGSALRRKFFKDAQMAAAGKEFAEGTPNLLRVQSLARISGLSTLGGLGFGPLGAGLAGTAALTLQNPQTIGKILVGLEKRAIKEGAKETIKKVPSQRLKNVQGATLRALISQGQRNK